MSYEQGFIDALDAVEHYAKKYGVLSEKLRKILEDLREAVKEKRLEKLRYELGLV